MISHSRLVCFFSLGLLLLYFGNFSFAQQKNLVNYTFTYPDTIRAGDTLKFVLTFDIEPGWHVYAPEALNQRQGMQPLRLQFQQLPDGIEVVDGLKYTQPMPKSGYLVFTGAGNTLMQRFAVVENVAQGEILLRGSLFYQACNDEICYPPMTERFSRTITAVGNKGRKSEADSMWEELEQSIALFPDESAYQHYSSLKPLDTRRYEDERYQRKAARALEFWSSFPDDPRRGLATKVFLSADPWFVAGVGNEAIDTFRTWKEVGDAKGFIRGMAIDTDARDAWMKQGETMVSEVLSSTDSTAEAKETAAFLLFARDFRKAAREYGALPVDPFVPDFWSSIEQTYWASIYHQFDAHVRTYPDNPNLALRATNFLASLKGVAPATAEQYWRRLKGLEWGGDTTPTGIVALREAAIEHLYALDVEAGAAPVDMEFTTLEGTAFNLKNLRGKLLLIDFWATWCKPCVEELPQVKALYDKYRDKGFEVIGICLDDEPARERVVEILTQHSADWPQRFEGVGFNKDAYRQLYGINSLPTVWLVDKDGNIIDRNARGEKLEGLIREQLNYVISAKK